MIKEITNFISSLDPDFKSLGIKPKDGLHILLSIQTENGNLSLPYSTMRYAFTRKKEHTPDEMKLLEKVSSFAHLSWCVNTNKCFDLPIKAIHSCSPYCVAIKRENLTGGGKFKYNIKSQVYERINSYFEKALDLIESENDKQRAILFKNSLNSEDKFNSWFLKIEEYQEIKDSDYIIFYLDEPLEKYSLTNEVYLADKLFNNTSVIN